MLCSNCGFDIDSHEDVEVMFCDNQSCQKEGCDRCIPPSHFWAGHVCDECEVFAIEASITDLVTF